MTNLNIEILRDIGAYLILYQNPPSPQVESSENWWREALTDAEELLKKWGHHPLAVSLLLAVYEYLEGRATGLC